MITITDRGRETMDYELYDTVTLAAGTNRFFGNTEAIHGSHITNQQTPNQLPVGQLFKIHSISCAGDVDLTTAEAKRLLKNTVLRLFIGEKMYFQTLCFRLPAGGGLFGTDSTATTPIVANGNPSVASEYRFKRILQIDSTTPFRVEVIADTPAVGLRMRVFLRGLLTRPVG